MANDLQVKGWIGLVREVFFFFLILKDFNFNVVSFYEKTFKIPGLSTILERKEEKNCFKKGNIFNIN